jgi:hypothetical protein
MKAQRAAERSASLFTGIMFIFICIFGFRRDRSKGRAKGTSAS